MLFGHVAMLQVLARQKEILFLSLVRHSIDFVVKWIARCGGTLPIEF